MSVRGAKLSFSGSNGHFCPLDQGRVLTVRVCLLRHAILIDGTRIEADANKYGVWDCGFGPQKKLDGKHDVFPPNFLF